MDLPEGQSRGFLPERNGHRVFAVRRGEQVYVYLNLCPHNWVALELRQHHFLTADRSEILCYAHGAHFAIESGLCTAGVCMGESLIKVPSRVEAGEVIIPLELPKRPPKPLTS